MFDDTISLEKYIQRKKQSISLGNSTNDKNDHTYNSKMSKNKAKANKDMHKFIDLNLPKDN